MMHVLTILIVTDTSSLLLADTIIGPEGHKLGWLLAIAVAGFIGAFFFLKNKSGRGGLNITFPSRKKLTVELRKDRLYYPRYLQLKVTNRGKSDVKIGHPLLVLKGFWYSRKFKIKGTNKNWYYPLYLMKDQSHTLNIDLHRFYGFDKTLKRLPKVKVVVNDVKGRRLGSSQVLLRKTLFNF